MPRTPLLLLVLAAWAGDPDPDAPAAIQASLERMRGAVAGLKDATYTLHKQEWIDGKALPAQTMAAKYRQPEDLYLRWTGEVYVGREVMYCPADNDGKLKVNAGALVPTIDLDPTGATAMRGSRQPVWMGSVVRTAEQILAGADKLTGSPTLDASYVDKGTVMVRGQPSHCYQAELPVDQDPEQYAPRVLVCMSLANGLPTRFAAWERHQGGLRKVEDYEFVGVVVNPGLDDADFDPENPAYGF